LSDREYELLSDEDMDNYVAVEIEIIFWRR